MKQTQRETAYLYIREKLAAGTMASGTRLSPAGLALEIGISPVPVREAISQLKSEGIVVHEAHKGAFVRAIDRQELVEMIEVRTMIECHAVAQAARRMTHEQLLELKARFEDLQRLAEGFRVPPDSDLREPLAKWHLGDLAFHNVILQGAGNRHALRFLALTRVMTHMFGYRTDHPAIWADPAAFGARSVALHVPIVEAICRRDPKAARKAMKIHMRASRKNILSRFDWLHHQREMEKSKVEEFPDSLRELIGGIQQAAGAPKPSVPPDARGST